MDVEIEYEEEVVCPHCGKKHVVKGVAVGEIEPPDRDEDC